MSKVVTVGATTLFACTLCAIPLSLRFSPEKIVSLSVDSASAEIGRPLTPMSVAGVNRRAHRRAYRQEYYGANSGPYDYGTYQPAGVAAGVVALGSPYNYGYAYDNYGYAADNGATYGGLTYQGGPRSPYYQRSYGYDSPYRYWTQF
jgi:hypothetical protein